MPGFGGTLTYDPDRRVAEPDRSTRQGQRARPNRQAAATAINSAFNSGASLPASFSSLFGLPGGSLAGALSQVDGEAATGAEKGAFELMDQFLGLMLDPFVDGRSGTGWPSGGGANAFAPEQRPSHPVRDRVGLCLGAQGATVDWSRAGAHGAQASAAATRPTAIRWSARATSPRATTAMPAGIDYHVSPDTVAGFALAGGGTNWGLAQGLGSGRSDASRPASMASSASVRPISRPTSPSRITGSPPTAPRSAISSPRASTARATADKSRPAIAPIPCSGDRSASRPTRAVQVQSFRTPSYSETDLTGGGFGLSYNAMNATDTRGGSASLRRSTMLNGMPLVLRARAAWAHDWVTKPRLGAVFQALPGGASPSTAPRRRRTPRSHLPAPNCT